MKGRNFANDPAYLLQTGKLQSEYAEQEATVERFLEAQEDIESAFKAMYEHTRRTGGTYAKVYSLGWRLWQLRFGLRQQARQEFNAEIAKYPDPVAQADATNNELVRSVEDRDETSEYRKYNQTYRKMEGNLNREARGAYKNARDALVQRDFRESNVIFTTLNNSGCKPLIEGFRSTAIVIDEAGQASTPALCIPLVNYPSSKGLFLFGDPQQLRPVVISSRANEAVNFAQTSPLELLLSRKHPYIFLDTQYRICPAISSFPAKHFYEGKLGNHQDTEDDNSTREAMRRISRDCYGVAGPDGNGSEYWFVNVQNGAQTSDLMAD